LQQTPLQKLPLKILKTARRDESPSPVRDIFVEREGKWLLVAHHASPLPTVPRSTV
jgi:hypothetical protein